jgi:uncharacterized protein
MRFATEHVLVMAKAPMPGRVKTRLCPPLTPDEAADIATAALADTLAAVASCGARRSIIALDGPPGPWLPPGFEVIPQHGDGFDARLANAWVAAAGPGVQIGMDTPQVTAGDLNNALSLLDEGGRPAVLGPALDGGWWLIGWRNADPWAVFRGVPMSTYHTGAIQARRLQRLGLLLRTVAPARDIDTADDLAAVADRHPGLRTSQLATRLGVVRAVA